MILAVNPNTGLDYILFVDNLPSRGTVQVRRLAWGMGGKALAAAWMLGMMGEPVLVGGFAGGYVGRHLKAMLEGRGVACDFVWLPEESRLNVVLVDRSGDREVTLAAPGVQVKEKQVYELLAWVERGLASTSCLLLGGSLPPGCPTDLYAQMILKAREAGVPVVLDARGESLRLGVEAGPTAVKPNRAEAEELCGRPISSVREAVFAVQKLQTHGVRWAVVTLGAQGLIGLGDGETWYVPPPPVEPVTTVGAGDAVTAGLAWGLRHNVVFSEALRWAVALAGATMRTPGTGDLDLASVEWIADKLILTRL